LTTLGRGGIEHLLDGLCLRQEQIEGELRVGHIIGSLGLRDEEASLRQIQFFEQLPVSHAQVRERLVSLCELIAQGCVVIAQRSNFVRQRDEALVLVQGLRAHRVLHANLYTHARDYCRWVAAYFIANTVNECDVGAMGREGFSAVGASSRPSSSASRVASSTSTCVASVAGDAGSENNPWSRRFANTHVPVVSANKTFTS